MTSSDERVPNSLSARSIWVFHAFSPRATQAPSFPMAPSPVNHSVSFVLREVFPNMGAPLFDGSSVAMAVGRRDGRHVRGVSPVIRVYTHNMRVDTHMSSLTVISTKSRPSRETRLRRVLKGTVSIVPGKTTGRLGAYRLA